MEIVISKHLVSAAETVKCVYNTPLFGRLSSLAALKGIAKEHGQTLVKEYAAPNVKLISVQAFCSTIFSRSTNNIFRNKL